MPSSKYIPGSVWGRKEILRYHSHNRYKQPTYVWRCIDCLTEYGPTTGTDLARSPYARCCQFLSKRRSDYRGSGDLTGERFAKYRASALKRGLAFEVDALYLWNLYTAQGPFCRYSGLPISFQDGTASIDRIDSSLGYVEGNIQWVHKKVNIMKWDFPEKEFLELCSMIASRKETK